MNVYMYLSMYLPAYLSISLYVYRHRPIDVYVCRYIHMFEEVYQCNFQVCLRCMVL